MRNRVRTGSQPRAEMSLAVTSRTYKHPHVVVRGASVGFDIETAPADYFAGHATS